MLTDGGGGPSRVKSSGFRSQGPRFYLQMQILKRRPTADIKILHDLSIRQTVPSVPRYKVIRVMQDSSMHRGSSIYIYKYGYLR